MKKKYLKASILLAIAFCMAFFAACDTMPTNESSGTGGNSEQTQSQKSPGQSDEEPRAESSGTMTESPSSQPPQTSSEPRDDVIEKISGGADEKGIYSIVITLSDKAADKGVIEMVYYGAKGSPQENAVVNTFRIEYEKADGLFEINTFSDDEVYQNLHKQTKVKVTNTFGAALRARNVIIFYAPEGGEKQEIFTADAELFYDPAS